MNVFKIKKIVAPTVVSIMAVVPFWLVTLNYGVIYGSGAFVLSLVLGFFINSAMLKNPFTQMLEGEGLITLDISSKGVISPFIMSLQSPFMVGKYQDKNIEDYYNRRGISQIFAGQVVEIDEEVTEKILAEVYKAEKEYKKSKEKLENYKKSKLPEQARIDILLKDLELKDKLLQLAKADVELYSQKVPIQTRHNRIIINLDTEKFSNARMVFSQYPCLMYNSQLDSVITKDFFSEKEKSFLIENKLLYLAKKVQGLSDDTKNFARHVIDLTNKSGGLPLKGIGIFIVVTLVVGGIGYLVAKSMGWM